ncbi:MAG: glycogen/starch synthase [Saprospiraceae bacterium]|nr:glycogen/starch synthase [Saprospiraceae bacterium]
MSKKKILFVTQELNPYTELSILSDIARKIPAIAHDKGFEFRVLMPKFGIINERRHRLHEVVRLSGMNIIVDDEDYPLIIKVASLPGVRLQVYFLDNEEFFKRKAVFYDDDGSAFDDNQQRLVFFCKGVMETVKKFGWAPDIVHLHGQMTSLIPLYIKEAYKNDPVFRDAKIIYSMYEEGLGKTFNKNFLEIAAINDLESQNLEVFESNGEIDLNKGALKFSDAITAGNENLNDYVIQQAKDNDKFFLEHIEGVDEVSKSMLEFYEKVLEK